MPHPISTKASLTQQDLSEPEAAFDPHSEGAIRRAVIGWWPYDHDTSIASVRIRCLHPLAHLRSNGYPVELFDPRNAGNYRAVLISKHFSQKSLEAAQGLKQSGVRIVYDFCDNYFHNPMEESKRQGKTARLRQFLELADKVVVSTEALAEVVVAESKLSGPVSVIGDAVEQDPDGLAMPLWRSWAGSIKTWRWARRIGLVRSQGRSPIVWFGNRGSSYAGGLRDIRKIRDVLEAVDRDFPLALTVISNSKSAYREAVWGCSFPTHYVEWDLKSSASIIAQHDVSVIPIVRNPITLCKTNNRLAFALHLGVSVVADSIPSYEVFSEACILDDWEGGLRSYLSDDALRRRHVAVGRAIIDKNWTVQTIAQKWAALFDSVLQA